MSERTERSEGREGMPGRHGMSARMYARADHPVRPGPYRRGGVRP
ncbi:DEAD/DEAH box helicase domain-containing protein [Micromonospora sp. L5]|nr:DEAD/DEAH box helicase domain-containing protein [Micromonospora sp. L5]